jgi:replicative DNA helicase
VTEEDEGMTALPPHDIAAEKAALGAMMLSADALAVCLDQLTEGSFFRPAHQIIFAALAGLAADGRPADWVTVKAELERQQVTSKTGGPLYTHELVHESPAASHGVSYAQRLLELQAQRDAGQLAWQVRQLADDPELSPRERLDQVSEAVDALTDTTARSEVATAADLIGPLMDALEAGPSTVRGIPSGWAELDDIIHGFRPGEVVVIGARPGMGKSVVLLNAAAHAAIRLREHVLAVTLEMSRDEYMERLLAAEAGVDLTHIRQRSLSDHDWDRVARAHASLSQADTLHIHEGPDLSVQGIRAELRAMRRAGKAAAMVTVDYMQLMEASGRQRESRQLEVSAMSRSIKMMAREFGIPVLIGSQLNRGPEMRTDKRPQMADLRESGAIENDADMVIMLYREDAYVEDSPRAGEIDLIVAKNRPGAKGTATLAFRGHLARCSDLYRAPEPPQHEQAEQADWAPPTGVLELVR